MPPFLIAATLFAACLTWLAPRAHGRDFRPGLKLGSEHACLLLRNGTSRCYGFGFNGPLGMNSRSDVRASAAVETPWPFAGKVPIREVFAGTSKTCAVLYDGRAYCLGLSPYSERDPLISDEPLSWGTMPGDTEATQPARMYDQSMHAEFMLVSTISTAACISAPLQEGGRVHCSGPGTSGVTLMDHGSDYVEWSATTKPRHSLPRLLNSAPSSTAVLYLAGGPAQFCAIMMDFFVKCWGTMMTFDMAANILGDSAGEFAIVSNPGLYFTTHGAFVPTILELGSGKFHTSVINSVGKATSLGFSEFGQMGNTHDIGGSYGIVAGESRTAAPDLVFSDTEVPRSVCGGWQHTCMLFANKRIRCWGSNQFGQLGLPAVTNHTGINADLLTLPYLSLPGGADALEVDCGYYSTCALLDPATAPLNGGWVCWGLGVNYRLGTDSLDQVRDPSLAQPVPLTNETGLLKDWEIFPRLFYSANAMAMLQVKGPMFKLDLVAKARLTDTTTLNTVDVALTRLTPHMMKSTGVVPSRAPDMAAPARESTEMTVELLTAGDVLVAGPADGISSVFFDTGVGLTPMVSAPTGVFPASDFSVKISIPGWQSRSMGARAHGVCTIGVSTFVLGYDGEGDFVVCAGRLPTSQPIGPAFVSITPGYGFPAIPAGNTLEIFDVLIDEVDPAVGHYVSAVNMTITGDGFVNLVDGVLCRFSDPATPPVAATHTVPGTYIDVNETRCTRPPLPELGTQASYPYAIQLEVSFNGGVQWSAPTPVSVHGPHSLTLALPAALPVQGGAIVTLHGTGFVPSAAAKAKFVIAGDPDIIIAALFATSTQLFEATTIPFVKGSVDVEVYLAIDGQTFTTTPVKTTVFELISLTPNTGPVGGGTPISVTGRGFTPVSGSLFCGLSGGAVSFPAGYGSSSRVVCVTPPSPSGSAATFDFGVTLNAVNYAGVSGTHTFDYYNPTFTLVSPSIIPADTPTTSTDTFVLRGSGIIGGNAKCVLAGVARPAVVSPAGDNITCLAYPGLISEPISVMLNGVDERLTGLTMTFFELYQLLPGAGPASGSTVVTVLGARFPTSPAPVCRFGALPPVTGVLETASRLRCTAPASAPGTVSFDVSFDGGTIFSTSSLTFSYYATPAVTLVSPLSGQGGVDVTMRGTSFTDSATTGLPMRCKFGSTEVLAETLLLVAGTYFVCKAPSLAGSVVVEASFNDGATFTNDGLTFLYMSVLSVGPALCPYAGGTSLLVSGTGFIQTAFSVCRITAACCTSTFPATILGPGQLRCTLPIGGVTAADPAATIEVSNDGTTFTADGVTINLYDTPVITSIYPTHVPSTGNSVVTLTGSLITNTGPGLSGKFGAFRAPSCAYVSPSSMTCTTPVSAGTQQVYASMNSENDIHIAPGVKLTFTSLASVEPALGPVGGGTSVLFSGAGFVPGPGLLKCRFEILTGTAAGTVIVVPGTYTTGSQGSCVSPTVPGLAPGQAKVDIAVDGGTDFSETGVPYRYYANPSVSAVSPTSGPEQGAFTVTVYGANLNRTASGGAPAFCRFGKATSPVIDEVDFGGAVGLGFLCRAPANVGTVDVEVSLNNGYHYSNGSLGQLAYYTLFLTDPAAGPVTGATDVLIFGSNFKPSATATCRFGVLSTPATYINPAQVRCSSPPQSAGTVVIDYAHDSQQLYTSTAVTFYFFVGPTIGSIAPSHAPLGSGAVVTVLGTGFFPTPAFICRFGETVSVNATVVDSTLATCPMPEGDGVVEVTMSFNGGAQFGSFGVMFSYITLNSIFPSIGPAAGGSTVFFIGSGFKDTEGAKCVFGGVQVPARVSSATSLECDTPPTAVGTVTVQYTGDYGVLFTSPPLSFEFYETPQVTALEPTEGPSSGGYLVTVHGINFNNTAASSYCRVGLQNVLPTPPQMQILPTSFAYLCVVPRGSGLSAIEISLNDGVTFTNDNLQFVFFSVFAMVPTLGPATGNTPVVVSGTGFQNIPSAQCRFGAALVPAEFLSEAEVRCESPPSGAGLFPVEYTVDGVRFTGDNKLFKYFDDPVITAVVPPGGPTTGGNPVTLHGINFADVGVAIKCRFGLLTSNAVLGPDPGTVLCNAPPGSSDEVVALSLNNGFQFAESKLTYAYVSLSKISPDHGLVLGGTEIVISGTGFLAKIFVDDLNRAKALAASGSNSTVTGGAFQCDFGPAGRTPAAVIDGTRLSCRSPAFDPVALGIPRPAGVPDDQGFPTTFEIVGPNTFRSGSFEIDYSFDSVPLATSQDPVLGPATGGTRVVIVGTNFVRSDSIRCRFGGVVTEASISATRAGAKLTCTSPAVTGSVPLEISFNEQDFSVVGSFDFYSVASNNPRLGPSTGGTVITVFGDGFDAGGAGNVTDGSGDVTCRVGGLPTRAFYISPTEVHCIAPNLGDRGDGDDDDGATRSASPSSQQVNPQHGRETRIGRERGGDGLHARAFANAAIGTDALVTLAISGSGEASNPTVTYRYYEPFVVTAVSPTVGRTAGGLDVTVKGGPFDPAAVATVRCRFGTDDPIGSKATYVSPSELTCVTPPHLAASVAVEVSQNDQDWSTGPAFLYEECAPGTFARVFSDPCTPCPVSFFSSTSGSRQCSKCPPTSYADKEGSSACTPCPANSIIIEDERDTIAKCLCVRNFYTVSGQAGRPCLACPEGGVCPGELEPPLPLPGYWTDRTPNAELNDDEGFVFFQCDFPEACPGNGVTTCTKGYTGRLCSECDVGYFKRGQRCRQCPDSSYISIVAFFVFIVIVCLGLYKMVGTDVSAYGGTLNIIAYFFQVVGILAKIDLNWPVELESAMQFMSSPFSLDVDVLASECSIPEIGFQVKWVSMMMLPVIFFLVFSIIYVFAKLASICQKKVRGPTQASIGDGLVNAYLLFMALAYLMLVSTSFQIFDCTDRGNGEQTLDAQPSLLCYDDWWWRLAPLALGGIMIYGFIVPGICALLIHRNRMQLTTPRVVGRYGSIFIDYTPEKPYWESIVMIEKFSFALTMTFFTSFVDVQIIAFLLVTVMGLALQIVSEPFFVKRYNKLQTILRWCSCIMVVAGMIFRTGNFPVEVLRLIVIGCVFVILGGSCLGVAGIVVYDVIMIRRSLSGSLFPKSTSKYINLITHPQGRTTLMEWLGNAKDVAMQARVARVMDSLGQYYEANFDTLPDRTTPRRTTQRILNFFASDIFLDTPLPAVQMWFTEHTARIRKRGDLASISLLRDFLIVFTELGRFRLYESIGVKRSRIENLPHVAIPWLDDAEARGPRMGGDDSDGDSDDESWGEGDQVFSAREKDGGKKGKKDKVSPKAESEEPTEPAGGGDSESDSDDDLSSSG